MDSVEPAQPDSEFLSSRTCHRLTLAILFVGVLWRVVRYLLQFPMWGDEGMIAVNFYYLDYAEMTRRLENFQIAPLLFLWGERTALLLLGSGVLAMRLLPFLAGMTALALYWHLTGLLLKPRARLFAFAFLAVAIWPVSMCTLIKPYSLDLCMTLLLLVLAARWLREPSQSRWLIGLTLAAPLALLGSYPTAFVAGGVSLTLLLPAWRAGWRARTWFAAYNVAVLTGFLLAMYVGNNQMNTRQGGSTATAMTTYWAEGFPPSNPLMVLPWFLLNVTGQMCAYPLGASSGGSTLTFLCCAVGAWGWYKGGKKTWLLLLLSPLVLNLFASALHRYPFGTSCRLNQHLAPTMCLLAGLGLATLLEGPTWATSRRLRVNLLVAGLFLLVGLGGLTRDLRNRTGANDTCGIVTR